MMPIFYRCGRASSLPFSILILFLLITGAHAQTAAELLTRATTEAGKLREPGERALALADVARTQRVLGDERWSSNLTAAAATAPQEEDALARAMTLRGLTVRAWSLDRKLAEELRDKALSEAGRLPYAAQQSLALREIGRSLAELDRPRAATVFAEARIAAEKIDSPLFRAAAVRDLAAAVVPLDCSLSEKLFTQAAADLASIAPAEEPVQLAQVELLVSWSRSNLPAALAGAANIPDDRLRQVAYRRIVEALAPLNAEAAMQVAAKLVDTGQRGLAMAAVAESLAKTQPEVAAGMARSAATMTEGLDPDDAARLQGAAASAIAATDVKEALLLASRIENEEQAARVAAHVAMAVSNTDPSRAAVIAGEITDWEVRETTQVQLAPALAAKDLAAALATVDGILSRRVRVQALLAIAEAVAGASQQ